jgi:hypothetical protein
VPINSIKPKIISNQLNRSSQKAYSLAMST